MHTRTLTWVVLFLIPLVLDTTALVEIEVSQLRTCLLGLVSNISTPTFCQTAAAGDNSTTSAGLAVQDYVASCLGLDDLRLRALRLTVPNAALLPVLQNYTVAFAAAYNITVELNPVDTAQLNQEVLTEAQQQLEGYSDGWVVDPSIIGDLVAMNALANLTGFVFEDTALDWSDVSLFFREVSAIFNGNIVGVPLDGDLLLMYYRRDLFDAYNLSVPATWDEFIDLAHLMNDTDTDGDGVGDLWGVCFDNAPGPSCKSAFIITAILAPYVQFKGTQQGVYIDPDTMTPLLNNSGMYEAIEHYMRLFEVQPKDQSCQATNAFFASGQCLMTINFGDEFKANAMVDGRTNRSVNTLGVSRLPGATTVFDRDSGQFITCTGRDVCPYADEMRLANGSTAWVNYAPFSAFGGWTGMVNARSQSEYQELAYKFFSLIARPDNNELDVLNPNSGIDPDRRSLLALTDENIARWTQAGYDWNATVSYLVALNYGLESPNMVLDIRLKHMSSVTRAVMAGMAENTTWLGWRNPSLRQAPEAVMSVGQSTMQAALNSLGETSAVQLQYCELIGCKVIKKRQQPKVVVQISGPTKQSSPMVILLSVLVPVGALLAGTILGVLIWRRKLGHRNLLHGAVIAPLAHPQTSLVITDIQDSTSLWEALPEEVMDAALKTHHAVIRHALAKHSGYESATEGDSFILAFHRASDAVACALRIQSDLLTAPWPQPLLRCAQCDSAAEVWVAPTRGAQHTALMEILGGETGERKKRLDGRLRASIRWGGDGDEGEPLAPLKPPMRPHVGRQHLLVASSGAAARSGGRVAATWPPTSPLRGETKESPFQEPQQSLGGSPSLTGEEEWPTQAHATGHNGQVLYLRTSSVPMHGTSGRVGADGAAPAGAWAGAYAWLMGLVPRFARSQQQLTPTEERAPGGLLLNGNADGWNACGRSVCGQVLRNHVKAAWVAIDPPAAARTFAALRVSDSPIVGGSHGARASTPTDSPTGHRHDSCREAASLGCAIGARTAPQPAAALLQCHPLPHGDMAGRPPPPSISVGMVELAGVAVPERTRPLRSPELATSYDSREHQLSVSPPPLVLRPSSSLGTCSTRTTFVQMPLLAAQLAAASDDTAAPAGLSRLAAAVAPRQLAFRGLRVRMGIHSGIPEPDDVSYNQAEARSHYSGAGMALARGVQGAAAGGQILLSDATFALIRHVPEMKQLRDAVLLHLGEHELEPKLPGAQQLYQAIPRHLLCRLALQPPLKVMRTVSSGVLDAPVSRVAVAFLSVAGAATLLAWNADVTRRALAVFHSAFASEAAAVASCGSYIVESTSGLLLATFASSADALATCLAVQSAMLLADWPAKLLEHELCEQVTITSPQVEGTILRKVLFRGLRIKAGIDCGPTRAALNGATGRIAYRGRVMNRAARISSQATSGQILCSSAAWQGAAAGSGEGLAARGLAALSLGPIVLKGICEPVEVLEVRSALASPRAPLLGRAVVEPESFTVAAGPASPGQQPTSISFWGGGGGGGPAGGGRDEARCSGHLAGCNIAGKSEADAAPSPVEGRDEGEPAAAVIRQRTEAADDSLPPAALRAAASSSTTRRVSGTSGPADDMVVCRNSSYVSSAALARTAAAAATYHRTGSSQRRSSSLAVVRHLDEQRAPSSAGGSAVPLQTIQVFRVDATTGIAALDRLATTFAPTNADSAPLADAAGQDDRQPASRASTEANNGGPLRPSTGLEGSD